MSELIDRSVLKARMYSATFDIDTDMQRWDSGCWIRYKLFENIVDDIPTVPYTPRWRRVEEELPKESNCYIVYLRQGTEMRTPEWMGGEPLSYVTEMGFDKEQMLWKHGDDAYNAILSAVDTKKDFHVTHWTEMPEPPKEDNT